jgi:hypothetical protein
MRKGLVFLGLAAVAAAGFAGTSNAQDTDGWIDSPDGGGIVTPLSNSTTVGVTRGTQSLRVDVPQGVGAFWGPATRNVVAELAAGATTLSYDETLIGVELNGGSFGAVFPDPGDNSFNGFAQSNELAVVISAPAGGFIQRNFTSGGGTDSLGLGAQWSGVDGTRTITWNLNNFTSGGMSLSQFIAANAATEARIWITTQGGDSNGNQGPMRFYFDNATLSGGNLPEPVVIGDFEPIPEPATAGLLGLAGLALLARRQRRCV